MRKILAVFLSVFAGFLAEYVFASLFGPQFKPNFLIILVVFFNLARGIRYSLITAFIAGILADSFSIQTFGFNIFSFICCAYLTTFIKIYIYQPGAQSSRVLMVFLISIINVLIHYFLNALTVAISFGEMFVHVLIPEVLLTTLVAPTVFGQFKKCVLKYFA